MATITSEAWTNQSPKNVNTYPHTYLLSSKTMRGSLFPLLPLRVKCQNHERVPISPISPILVVHALSSCQDMGHQNRGNRAFHGFGTSSRESTERVPISPTSPKGEVPKPWEGPYFLCQDMDHQNRGNRWNRDPSHGFGTSSRENTERVPISPISPKVPKPWEGPYFPYFGGACLGKMKR